VSGQDDSLTVWHIGGEQIRSRFTVIVKSGNLLPDCLAFGGFISPRASREQNRETQDSLHASSYYFRTQVSHQVRHIVSRVVFQQREMPLPRGSRFSVAQPLNLPGGRGI